MSDKKSKLPVCVICVHYKDGTRSCKAFKEIPDEIWKLSNSHTEPFEGDGGVQFEKCDGGTT